MKTVFAKALVPFNRVFAGGQMIVGHPEHPDALGRFPEVTEDQFETLVSEGLVDKKPAKSRDADEAEAEQLSPIGKTTEQVIEDQLTAGTDGGPVGGTDSLATTAHDNAAPNPNTDPGATPLEPVVDEADDTAPTSGGGRPRRAAASDK